MERAENFEMEMVPNLKLQHGETSFSEVGHMINNLSTLDDQNSSMGEFQPIEDLNKRLLDASVTNAASAKLRLHS